MMPSLHYWNDSARTITSTPRHMQLRVSFVALVVVIVTHIRTAACTSFTSTTTTTTPATYPTYDTALYDDLGIATTTALSTGKNHNGLRLVPPGTYPSFVTSGTEQPLCNGILIWPDVVLTAAHCVGAYNSSKSYVLIGGTVRSAVSSNAKERIFVKDYIQHPLYSDGFRREGRNDIMLVILKSTSNITVSPYNTNPSVPVENQIATVVGHNGLELADGNVTIVNAATCQKQIDIGGPICSNETFCGITKSDDVEPDDDCNDMSGGPVLDPATGIAIGIVSFGDGLYFCRHSPYGYTRVSTYASWVRETICKYSAVVNTTSRSGVCSQPPLQPPTTVSSPMVPTPPISSPITPPTPPIRINISSATAAAAATDDVCVSPDPPRGQLYCKDVFNGIPTDDDDGVPVCTQSNYMHKRIFFFWCRKACIDESDVIRKRRLGWRCGPCPADT